MLELLNLILRLLLKDLARHRARRPPIRPVGSVSRVIRLLLDVFEFIIGRIGSYSI